MRATDPVQGTFFFFTKSLHTVQQFCEKEENLPPCRRRIGPFVQTTTWFGTDRVPRASYISGLFFNVHQAGSGSTCGATTARCMVMPHMSIDTTTAPDASCRC